MGKTLQIFGFPSNVTAKEVKEFLEEYTGTGSIYALKIRQSKVASAGAFAIVQFTTIENTRAQHLLAKQLRYKNSKLRAETVIKDIVPIRMVTVFNLENVGLFFGCQISDEKFSVLWECNNVDVSCRFGLQKLFFFLSHCDVRYKLELSSQNIRRIQLRHIHGQLRKFLLIQVIGTPRIYEKILQSSEPTIHEESASDYYKYNIPDDQWVRTTDFTPSCSIAQSSCICLKLPQNCELPNIRELFFNYKEDEGRFDLENGSSFCRNLDLVPIVQPPEGFELPFDILYKVSSLVQHGYLSGQTLDRQFFSLIDPRSTPRADIEQALNDLYRGDECFYEPVKWLGNQYRTYQTSKNVPKMPRVWLGTRVVNVRRVQVTPCKVYFYGPEPILSNRVLRHYPKEIDNFIRVSFVDEEFDKISPMDLSRKSSASDDDRYTGIYRRILSVLKNGIVIGDKKFEFLAFSASQLRENSVWMFASTNELSADSIREWMGNFRNIRNVAKFAARLGQSFGSSIGTLTVNSGEIEVIPDVKIEGEDGTKYVFSDGIGKISVEFARRVAADCNLKDYTPSAFQIRYAGYKGVVALDPTSTAKLSLRPSMAKYDSETTKLDVLSWSKFHPCYLNRQIIFLLSTLGVEDHIFETKQKEVLQQLDLILTDPFVAREVLDIMSFGENTRVLKEMLKCGYKPDVEPYLSRMLRTFRLSKLLDLRTRSRIFVPQGRAMLGCLDETGTLDYGEVFIQVSSAGYRQFSDSSIFTFGGVELSQQTCIVTGTVVVAKNPCLHPGDVRVLRAVHVPALRHMVNCLVFPQKGKRPHPNECSGSDLDGDIYFVSWDPLLIPPRQVQPMHYSSEPNTQLDHEVTIEEVEEYFAKYMANDCLGVIANTHTVFADKEIRKAESDACLELAKQFSIAVDFNKTGIPAHIPSYLHVKEYPDFMEKHNRDTYVSRSVIGKLYREVKDIAPKTFSLEPFTQEMARKYYDCDMEVDGYKGYLVDAYERKKEYDHKLEGLMEKYGIKTEAELVSGNIINESKSFQKLNDPEEIGLAVRSLRREARAWFTEESTKSDSQSENLEAKASAWYHVTYHPDYWGCYNEGKSWDHFLSFPWCVCDELLKIKKKKMMITPGNPLQRRRLFIYFVFIFIFIFIFILVMGYTRKSNPTPKPLDPLTQ